MNPTIIQPVTGQSRVSSGSVEASHVRLRTYNGAEHVCRKGYRHRHAHGRTLRWYPLVEDSGGQIARKLVRLQAELAQRPVKTLRRAWN